MPSLDCPGRFDIFLTELVHISNNPRKRVGPFSVTLPVKRALKLPHVIRADYMFGSYHQLFGCIVTDVKPVEHHEQISQ